MDNNFLNVKVLIWDFDGTLYKPLPSLWKKVREAEYQTIRHHTGWTLEKVITEFQKIYKIKFDSATQTAAALSGIPIAQAAVEMEQYFDRREFVVRDEKLIELFGHLKKYRHFILANGMIAKHKETLAILGLPPDTFEEIITSETVGVTKPDEKGFRYILDKTKLPPGQHMMIGDREEVDLVPAKAIGMKTCLVWSEIESTVADITLRSVYDLEKILG